MHKKIFILLFCLGFFAPASNFTASLKAQTLRRQSSRQSDSLKDSAKSVAPAKASSAKRFAAAQKSLNGSAGDPCSSDTPIALGQTLNGTLSAGDCSLDDGTMIDFYSFTGNAGQPISLAMNSQEVDTYLFLFDEAGNSLAENDDSGTNTDSRIPAEAGVVTLPYTGIYYIGANSFEPAAGGYSISLNSEAACAAEPIGFNQPVSGSLTSADCAVFFEGDLFYTDRFSFSGTAGEQISIAMNSTAVNSYLILYTPSGEGSLDDDNGGGANNARIPANGAFTLPETGTYTIEASGFEAAQTGDYTLVLSGTNSVPGGNELFDYDGDGKADISVYRPSSGTWFVRNSSAANSHSILNFGLSSDKITPADYDGDGKTDFAVFRGAEGNWYVFNSASNLPSTVNFGIAGDIPVPADFDGDRRADYAVYRPSTGTWWINQSTDGATVTVSFGSETDQPTAGDYDGDGKTDVAVWRASNGAWYVQKSSDAQVIAYQFGLAADIPVPADFDGDGKTDFAVFRPASGTWYIANSTDNSVTISNFGLAEDKPVAADYDGDGKADIAVFRPSTGIWYLLQSSIGFGALNFGLATDQATPNAFLKP